jgi:hypothetical protein
VGSHRLRRIENIAGGSGADVLGGDAGPNELFGGEGDRLAGRAGDDVLLGAPRVASGGAGDDALPWPVDERLDCGPGDDAIPAPDGPSVLRGVPRSCEWYAAGPLWLRRTLRLDGAALIAHAWNRDTAPMRLLRWALSRAAAPAATVVDEGYDDVPAGARRALRLPLTAAGRAHFARGGSSVFLTAVAEESPLRALQLESAFPVARDRSAPAAARAACDPSAMKADHDLPVDRPRNDGSG